MMRRVLFISLCIMVMGALVGCSSSNTSEAVTVVVTEVKNEAVESSQSPKENEMKEVESVEISVMNSGNAAPLFTLMSIKDEEVSLEALKGEKVYVKFWASWCSICLAGMEDLNELAGTADFKVYTIVSPGIKGEQKKDAFIDWFKSLGYDNVEVLLDESGDVMKHYGVRAFPTSAYVGSDGILVKVLPGHVSNETVKATLSDIK
jgi:thiol-disulfide isomerase/thioredoxin